MDYHLKRALTPWVAPVAVLVAAAFASWLLPRLAESAGDAEKLGAFLTILPVLPYAVFFLAGVLGWRYANMGMVMAGILLAGVYLALTRYGAAIPGASDAGPGMGRVAVFLLGPNLIFCTFLFSRRPFTPVGAAAFAVVGFQVFAASVFCYPELATVLKTAQSISPALAQKLENFANILGKGFAEPYYWNNPHLVKTSLLSLAWSMGFLGLRFFVDRTNLAAGFCAAALAVLTGLCVGSETAQTAFFLAAGLILLLANIETGFSMAYLDELTGLPGRRALNEAMVNLGKKYAIAMIDIDHFKKFNDKYGHKTGDQVLRMVAVRLRAMAGGAKTYRYGGEEFTAIFPGKSASEAAVFLEQYRMDLETTPFTIRSKKRKQRSPKDRGKGTLSTKKRVKVTVSIGVSQPAKNRPGPEQVIKQADKVLYKAKKGGRNRVVEG